MVIYVNECIYASIISAAGKSHSNFEAQWFDASADPNIYNC